MTGKELRIVFMGTPEFAAGSLRRLVEGGYNVVAVVTMPDKPAGRGLKMQQSAVKEYALGAGLRVLQPEKLRDPGFLSELGETNADLGIVIAFRMLPEPVWSRPRLGTFNLHASLLPQYRGAAPINRAIIDGETRTGVTTFFLNDEIDKGDVIERREVAIEHGDTAGTLHDKLMSIGSELVITTVEKIAAGGFEPLPQTGVCSELRQAPKIFGEDRRIDWNRSPEEIRNLVRGLSPYPAATALLMRRDVRCDAGCDDEGVPVKIYAVAPEPREQNLNTGEIVSDGKTFFKAACRDGFVSILELQAAGKKRMTVDEFLRGFKDIGDYRFA